MINYYVSIHYTIHFIGCHPVSPQVGKGGAGKWENQWGKHGKSAGPKGGREEKSTNGSSEARKNGRKSHGRHETSERKTVICRVGSELPLSPTLFSYNNGGLIIIYDYTLHRFDLDLCVVGRFACQVPDISATRTAIPERFFGRKITAGNFMSRKPEA